MAGELHIFGIRHHGPGSSRSLLRALEALEPDCVLIEGPPDAQQVVSLVQREDLKPPVALLVYVPGEPRRAVFYPFAVFSPEWQALRYALSRSIEVRFIDLPQWHRLAVEDPVSAPALRLRVRRRQGLAIWPRSNRVCVPIRWITWPGPRVLETGSGGGIWWLNRGPMAMRRFLRQCVKRWRLCAKPFDLRRTMRTFCVKRICGG